MITFSRADSLYRSSSRSQGIQERCGAEKHRLAFQLSDLYETSPFYCHFHHHDIVGLPRVEGLKKSRQFLRNHDRIFIRFVGPDNGVFADGVFEIRSEYSR